jgi:hypothetical protein
VYCDPKVSWTYPSKRSHSMIARPINHTQYLHCSARDGTGNDSELPGPVPGSGSLSVRVLRVRGFSAGGARSLAQGPTGH